MQPFEPSSVNETALHVLLLGRPLRSGREDTDAEQGAKDEAKLGLAHAVF